MFSALGRAFDTFHDEMRQGAEEIRAEVRQARAEARRARDDTRRSSRSQRPTGNSSQEQNRTSGSSARNQHFDANDFVRDMFNAFDYPHTQNTNERGNRTNINIGGINIQVGRDQPSSSAASSGSSRRRQRQTAPQPPPHQPEQSQQPGLSEEQIKRRFKRHQYTKDEGCCSICMDDYIFNYTVRSLPCHHYFHVDCIDPWLRRNASCPECRLKLD